MSDHLVLVVDDDAAIRESLQALLEDDGHEVRCAAHGQQALEAALALVRAGRKPCLILLDLMMPVMDGAEFRTRQLADPDLADIPVALITAAGAQVARTVPVDVVLPKPFKVDRILEVVIRHCVRGTSAPSSK